MWAGLLAADDDEIAGTVERACDLLGDGANGGDECAVSRGALDRLEHVRRWPNTAPSVGSAMSYAGTATAARRLRSPVHAAPAQGTPRHDRAVKPMSVSTQLTVSYT